MCGYVKEIRELVVHSLSKAISYLVQNLIKYLPQFLDTQMLIVVLKIFSFYSITFCQKTLNTVEKKIGLKCLIQIHGWLYFLG